MEEVSETDSSVTLAEFVRRKQGKKNLKIGARKKTKKGRIKKIQGEAIAPERSLPLPSAVEDQNVFDISSGITVSSFDFSIDNHFNAIDTICKLSGEPVSCHLEKNEADRLSSSMTFLREWRNFNYPERKLRFACQTEIFLQRKDVCGEIKLPQFSSATVPASSGPDRSSIPPESRKDFVMYVGGLVWALDWCPRAHYGSDSHIKCEFIAVAAHPPESSHHKVGMPLIGRGLIQIWCLLNVSAEEEEASQWNEKPNKRAINKKAMKARPSESVRPKGRPRKNQINIPVDSSTENSEYVEALAVQLPENSSNLVLMGSGSIESDGNRKRVSNKPAMKTKSSEPKRSKGSPRKNQINVPVDNSTDENQYIEALAVELQENSSHLLLMDSASVDTNEKEKRISNRKNKGCHRGLLSDDLVLTSKPKKRRLKDKARGASVPYGESLPLLAQNESVECFAEYPMAFSNSGQEVVESSESIPKACSLKSKANRSLLPKDVALPRVVLCLAHNGKVAWDVKWRPSNVRDTEAKHRMGYLAVLLGNGALEVWEVPSPQAIKAIYFSLQKEGTDPRFLKLEPVFRCSKLKFGDRQSIPLTVEWSSCAPHDLILAGCHDGVVALWKFSANVQSEDTKPLLCFSADTVPIRALAWAPVESDPESAHVVVTAGHKGLKFWDIRDPFRPLWDLNPVQRNIYSLDWLPDPGCVIMSFDDGTLRILSLSMAAYDVPVTGKPFVGTQHQGLHSYYCSSFAIWSIQVSRLTGMVAYCGADGNVLQFQLTHKAVEKDPHRNRSPHFLCGSLCEEESTLIVVSPLPNTPFPMKKSLNEWGTVPRTIRGFLSASNQEKRAKEQTEKGKTSDDQTLALCCIDDQGTGSESEDLMLSQKAKRMPKSKPNGKKKLKFNLALVCRGEDKSDRVERENSGKGEIRAEKMEKFPSKMVAMHRVRWNMNRGSERWLCSGGASGLVRVQEIKRPFV